MTPVTGGDISQAFCLTFPSGQRAFFKANLQAPQGFFAAEADGLAAIAAAGAIRVPEVYAYDDHGILLEWLDVSEDASQGHPHGDSLRGGRLDAGSPVDVGEALGVRLAALHAHEGPAFGFESDNFIGLLPQRNTYTESWTAFYREQRLRPQLEIADARGRLSPARRRRAERLLNRLHEWIDDGAVKPSLIHGDLWQGNWLATTSGPALIDPAVYYGDREMDLAMASLFGGFPESFYRAYRRSLPLPPGDAERRPLYQLYYLLIHLNLFGEGYGPAVDRILARYGG